MERLILSICIASYNKSELTVRLVNSLLSVKSQEFEVVVVDNCSTDDTIAKLAVISDPRLKIVINDKNIGGAANTVKAVYCGHGNFSLYTNDRDIIFPERIPVFIEFLKQHASLSAGTCVRNKVFGDQEYEIVSSKEAISKYSFRCIHPSGLFYNKKTLNKIPYERIIKILDEDKFVPLLYEYVYTEAICKGETAIYNDIIWMSTGNSTHGKYISGYADVNVDISRKWFHSTNCLNRASYNIKYIQNLAGKYNLGLCNSDYNILFETILKAEHSLGIWRSRVIQTTPSLAFHYNVPVVKESYFTTLQNSKKFYHSFISMLKTNYEGDIDEQTLKAICKNENTRMIKSAVIKMVAKIYRFVFRKK